mgnify:CR=1 FL=1
MSEDITAPTVRMSSRTTAVAPIAASTTTGVPTPTSTHTRVAWARGTHPLTTVTGATPIRVTDPIGAGNPKRDVRPADCWAGRSMNCNPVLYFGGLQTLHGA